MKTANIPTRKSKSNSRVAEAPGPTLAGATPPSHNLETSLPYLLARAGIRSGQAFSAELKQFGLTLNDWRVGASLRYTPHQRLMSLARNTSVDSSTLSRLVDGLIQRGLVLRARSSEDARAVELCLTPEGESLIDKVIPLAKMYERVALAGIDAEQAELLRTLLHRIYDNMAMLERRV